MDKPPSARPGSWHIVRTSTSCGGHWAWVRTTATGAQEMQGCVCHHPWTLALRAGSERHGVVALASADRRELSAPASTAKVYQWSGSANDVFVTLITYDPGLRLFIKPVLNEHVRGIELVDQDGNSHASQVLVQPGAPSSTAALAVDPDELLRQIRATAEGDGSSLAALIGELDRHLATDGRLPDAWDHPDYDDWD